MKISVPPIKNISQLTVDSDLNMAGLYQVANLAAPAAGEALRKGNADIADAEIAAAAAIAYSKLALTGSIVNADISATAAIALSKLATIPALANTGTYTGDGTANRAIAHGLGKTPKLVISWNNTNINFIMILGSDPDNECYIVGGSSGFVQTVVTAMNSTNFYVSATYGNLNANVYYWVAIG